MDRREYLFTWDYGDEWSHSQHAGTFLPGQLRVALIFGIGYGPIPSEDGPETKAD